MTESKFDELIASALEQYTLDELREAIEDSSLDFDTSPIFRRRMVKMLRDPLRYLANRTRPRWQKVLRTAAAVFLCMLMLFGSAMMIPPVRAAVQRVFTEWHEEYVTIRFTEKDSGSDEYAFVKWRLADIPEGYEENVVISLPYTETILFDHASKPQISFHYTIASASMGISIDIEHHTLTETTFNGAKAYCFYPISNKNQSNFVWMDEKEQYVYHISGCLPMDQLITLAESLIKIPK